MAEITWDVGNVMWFAAMQVVPVVGSIGLLRARAWGWWITAIYSILGMTCAISYMRNGARYEGSTHWEFFTIIIVFCAATLFILLSDRPSKWRMA
jgi:hypothetical protein